jgi:hypothetical protein
MDHKSQLVTLVVKLLTFGHQTIITWITRYLGKALVGMKGLNDPAPMITPIPFWTKKVSCTQIGLGNHTYISFISGNFLKIVILF